MPKNQINIKDTYAIALLTKLARQDARRNHGPVNMTATLRDLLNAEDIRRTNPGDVELAREKAMNEGGAK